MRNKINIFYCLLDERLPQSSFDALLTGLPCKIKTRIQKFVRWQDAHACLMGYVLIEKFVLTEKQSLDSLQTNRYGKPYIENGPFFNLTHSGQLIALAIADFEIGIDAELIQEYDYLSFVDEFASEKEIKRILCSKNPLMQFYNYWTLKEACVKQLGKGLSIPLKSFEVPSSGVVYVEENKLKLLNVKMPLEDYVLNLAMPYDEFDDVSEVAINTNFVSLCDLKYN